MNTNLPILQSPYQLRLQEQKIKDYENRSFFRIYESLPEAKRVRLQVRAESIRSRLKRTGEDIIAIGQDLIDAKEDLGHGQFLPWLKAEFDMSEWSAQKFMQVTTKFGGSDKSVNFTDLGASVLYLLASPSTPETVTQEVLSGQIKATEDQTMLEAVREAKRAAVEAAKAKQKAEEETQLAQRQLSLVQSNSRIAQSQLEQEVSTLKLKLENMARPQEKIVYEDKPQTKAKLTELEEKQVRFRNELQRKEKDLNEIKVHNAKFAEENRKLTERMRNNLEEEAAIKERLRVQSQWRRTTDICYSTTTRIIGEIPSQIDQESLDGDDWARHAQCVEVLQRALSALGQMRNSQPDPFIDASIVDSSPIGW